MLQFLVLLAENEIPAKETSAPAIFNALPFIAIPIIFYFLLIRPGQKKERERVSLLSSLKKNDKVLTISGIYGTVVAVSDKDDEVTVRVDDNVRVKMTKSSIARNLTNEESAKAAPPKEGSAT